MGVGLADGVLQILGGLLGRETLLREGAGCVLTVLRTHEFLEKGLRVHSCRLPVGGW